MGRCQSGHCTLVLRCGSFRNGEALLIFSFLSIFRLLKISDLGGSMKSLACLLLVVLSLPVFAHRNLDYNHVKALFQEQQDRLYVDYVKFHAELKTRVPYLKPEQPISMDEFRSAMSEIEEVAIWDGPEEVHSQYRSRALGGYNPCGGPACPINIYAVFEPELDDSTEPEIKTLHERSFPKDFEEVLANPDHWLQ